MKRLMQFALFATTFALIGCTEPGHYPVTGEECGPNDPVLDMDAADCQPLPGI